MSTDDVVQHIGRSMGRRKFLGRAGAATLGAAFAVLGLPGRANAAVVVQCCTLCRSPGTTCCGSRPPVCTWSWTCCKSSGARVVRYRCVECYCSGGSCSGDCAGVTTSLIQNLGDC